MAVIRMRMGRMVVFMIMRIVVVMVIVMHMIMTMTIMTMIEMAVPRMMVMSVRIIAVGADPLDVMVVALLNQSNLALKSEHLRAVLAQPAVHLVLAL